MSFIGAEVNHLWPCRVYSPSADVGRASVTLARTSEPPCFSVIPMPARAPRFSASRPQAGVVRRGREQRRPLLGDRVVGPQRRDGGVRHRDRAAVPGLGVRPGHEAGRPADVRVRGLRLPGRGGQAVPDRALHQPVPGRVEGRPRRSGSRSGRTPSAAGGARWRAGRARAPRRCPPRRPRATRSSTTSAERVPGDGLDQREVGGDDVVPDERRGLVRGSPDVAAHVDTVGPCRRRRASRAPAPDRLAAWLAATCARCSGGWSSPPSAPACATASPAWPPRRRSSRSCRSRR